MGAVVLVHLSSHIQAQHTPAQANKHLFTSYPQEICETGELFVPLGSTLHKLLPFCVITIDARGFELGEMYAWYVAAYGDDQGTHSCRPSTRVSCGVH